MNKSRFDERCPHCEAKLDFYSVFQASDYEIEFDFECSSCGGKIEVYVHSVPEFEAMKAE